MRFSRGFAITCLVLLGALAAVPANAQGTIMTIVGETYTKWLWGTERTDGSLYNFTTIPGEGYGDNGQGTEFNLFMFSKPSKYVEVSAWIQSRFSQNQWTNFGGFGGRNPAFEEPPGQPCVGGDCGEFDPRSNEYIKVRGVIVRITPGYKLLDVATIGSTDVGMFDPFSIGKIRYIDRQNAKAVLLQGSPFENFSYDLMRLSLPRLWAGPNFNTGDYTGGDGAYAFQFRATPSSFFDFSGIVDRVRDIEVDATDRDFDDGRDIDFRYKNDVYGFRFGIHPGSTFDIRGQAYFSESESNPVFGTPTGFGTSGFSPVPAGKHDDETFKLNVDINDPFGIGLSFNLEYFDIGAEYVSVLAARRESDVLLTEGNDGAFAFPGPDNSAFGVFPGNPTRIGYGGWQGPAQQVATINVDNEFTDFDESMAESVIGWKGITVVPTITIGNFDLAAEYSKIDYNTNWQAWGDPTHAIDNSPFPNFESDAGINSFRNAYAPFQDRETDILLLRGKTVVNIGNGIDVFGKIKWIDETDDRMTESRFLPFQPGDCPGGGVACANNANNYFNGFSTAAIYFNPPVITVNGVTGYQWKPFNSLSDDDREMDYQLIQLGAGYQWTGNLYASLTYENYDVDLQDGNTAFQAYQLHSMASGQHDKNKVILQAKYTIGGAEFGFNYEYNWGEFDPDFGGGFVVQFADADTANNLGVPVGSPGFRGRFGGWNSLLTREFEQQRIKGFLKVRF